MHKVKLSHAKDHLRHIAIKKRIPVMMWGQPGIGKSEAVHQIVHELDDNPSLLQSLTKWIGRLLTGSKMVDIRLSQYDSVDLRGFPGEKNNQTVWFAPATLPFVGNPNFSPDELIILFLDEINSAAPAVAAVAYQLVNDRRVGEHVLMDNVVIIAAGNRETDRGVTNRQPLPLSNRFNHIEIAVDVDDWVYYIQDKGLPAIFVAFIKYKPDLLSTFDMLIEKGGNISKSFATPRTWMHSIQIWSDDTIPDHVKLSGVAGSVGDGPGGEFAVFTKIWKDLIPVSEIIKNPTKVRLPEEPSQQYATAISVSGAISMKTSKPLAQFLTRMPPEFEIMAWTMAVRRNDELFGCPEFDDMSKKYHGTVFNTR
jgi:hypothetical protein